MMKKTTSALAVAALLGTGAASAATFQVNEDSTISIGGDFQYAYDSTKDATGTEQTEFQDNGTSLVFSGEHAADNGLTTFFNLDLDGFETTDAGSDFEGSAVDEGSVGIRGAFGEILIGSNGGVYDSYADFADIEWIGDRTTFGGDRDDVIQYSNSVNNVSFTVEAQVGDNDGNDGDSTTDADADSRTALAAGASVDLGGVTLSGAYEDGANTDDEDPTYGIGAMANVGGVDVTVGYEVDDNSTNSVDKTVVNAAYTVGQVTVTGSMQNVSFDSNPTAAEDPNGFVTQAQTDDSFTETNLSVAYSMTSQLTVWADVVRHDRENDEGDYNAVGLYYAW